MLGGKPWEQWIEEYSDGHQHPMNRLTHKIGIPMIVVSLPLFLVAIFIPWFWILPTVLFIAGWLFQFVGHAFEGKPPEFFKDPRFLFVGLRWWIKKTFG
ncbi:MAG TPA: DUF962 domain-containing protein [Pyrinomonadaceae bacterium]|jgi:uncharacterized membrane protein YGL010W|nr:DUF962 domain-containing protein [Pyrinomonadaceae bacterium]